MQRQDAQKALDIYRRVGQQVSLMAKFLFLFLNLSVQKVILKHDLYVSRLRDCQSFMKYAVILILDVERSLLKLSRLV